MKEFLWKFPEVSRTIVFLLRTAFDLGRKQEEGAQGVEEECSRETQFNSTVCNCKLII